MGLRVTTRAPCHEILNARSSELGSERIDECDMSGPAGTAVANISAAFAALGYHLGIVGDILGRGVMDVIERHAQILADRAVEILELRIGEAALIGGGGDISVVVRPLIHCEHINVAAADIVEVDDLGDGAVNNGARIREDHNALLIEHIGCLDACDHIADPDGSGIIDHMDLEIRIRMNGHLLACDIAAALENFLILVRNKVRRLE